MYLKQGDLFWGMDGDFVKEVMDHSEKVDFEDGDVMFKEGNSADHFYVLIKGRIKLSIGSRGPVVYLATEPGQVIGWSSLVGRDTYSASALCVSPVKTIKFKTREFLEALGQHPENETMLYKRLAVMLGDRLTSLYPSLA